MNRRKLKKAILAEALRIHSHSGSFPVKSFQIHIETGKCSHREFKQPGFDWLDDLMQLCTELREVRRP